MISSPVDQNGYRCRYIFGGSLLSNMVFMCNIKLKSVHERTLYIKNYAVVTCRGVTKMNRTVRCSILLYILILR